MNRFACASPVTLYARYLEAGPLAAALASFARLCLGSEVQDKVPKKTFKTHLKRSRSFTAVHCSVPGRQAALFVCALFRCENCDCSDRALAQKTCVLCWMLGSRSGLAAETETTDDRLSFSTCGMFETEPTKLWQRYAFPCVPALFCV